MTQIMASTLAFASSVRPSRLTTSGNTTLMLTLAVILAITAAILLSATGNPIAFAIGAGIIVSVVGAAASWAAGLTL